MKNWLFLFLLLCATSCIDEEPAGNRKGDTVAAKLEFWLPALSTATQTKAMTEKDEYTMQDLSLLIFDANDKFVEKKDITITDGEGTVQQSASITLEKANENQSLVALANVKNLTGFPWPSDNEDKGTYLKKLEYASESAWPTVGDKRFFPMWGEHKGALLEDNININMLRALARVNITVADGVNFVLKEFTVHNSLQAGYVAPVNNTTFTDKGNVTVPSLPQTVSKGDLSYSIPEENEKSFVREIYIPEATTSADEGGVYFTLSGEMDGVAKLYHLYLTRNGKKDGDVLQVLRNHTYNINIESIGGNNDLNVTIEAMDECVMRSPYEQNTLTVSENLFYFNPTISNSAVLRITTTWEKWEIVDKNLDGFTIIPNMENNTVTITPSGFNKFASGYFYVQSGQLKKKIVLKSDPDETSNCYIRTKDGEYDLIVSVKGNGRDGMVADGVQLVSDDDLKLAPDKVGIIWETSKGLVRLMNKNEGVEVIDVASDATFNGVVRYKVTVPKGSKGGNALIGAFKNGVCIWSWHIWVVTDFDGGEEGVKVKEETWKETGDIKYIFIDRYIGALANMKGDVNSLGLLYQWGRKDPFIGAEKIERESKSQPTVNYDPCKVGNNPYYWKIDRSGTTMDMGYTIKNPTTLTKKGLCDQGVPLSYWGTSSGMNMVGNDANVTAVNEGNKTIYDPCPLGYRVPPVLAYIFGTGKSSNYFKNYNSNNRWVGYGFWLNFGNKIFTYNNGWTSSYRPYENTTNEGVDRENVTWLPVSGVYDPKDNSGLTASNNRFNSFSNVDKQSSLLTNSIVWMNSPIKIKDQAGANKDFRPGALFLHGKVDGSNGDHLHAINETGGSGSSTGSGHELYAQTQFAGSVRCVKIQENQNFSDRNEIEQTVDLGSADKSEKSATIKVINETWEVTNPGAPWFYLDKYSGNPDGGEGQQIVFTASEANLGDQRSATLTITTSKGHSYDIIVIQKESENSGFSVDRKSVEFDWNDTKANEAKIIITNSKRLTWTVETSSDKFGATGDLEGNLLIWPTSMNQSNKRRSGKITIKPSKGDAIVITVTQKKQR